MLRMKELAMKNEGIAYALVGQAILDEEACRIMVNKQELGILSRRAAVP